MRIRGTTVVLAFSLALALPGCGGSTETSSVLTAEVVPVEAIKVISGADRDPVKDAKVIKFTASGPGMADISTSYDFASGGGALPAFPEGYERQLTVEICKESCDPAVADDILSRGRTALMTLFAGDQKRETVFVATRNAFVAPSKVGEAGVETSKILNKYRVGATVTALDDGRLLIVGGAKIKATATTWYNPEDIESVTANAEIYDPRTGVFTAVEDLNQGRAHHAAVKLGGPNKADGRVVIMGGYVTDGGAVGLTDTVEIFNPKSNSFVMESQKLEGAGRALLTAGLAYPDQNIIFLAGGRSNPPERSGAWRLYLPGTGTVGAGGLSPAPAEQVSGFGTARWNHTMTYLPAYAKDGKTSIPAFVLMGGENDNGTLDTVEAYLLDPPSGGRFTARRDETVTQLPEKARTLHSTVYVARQDIVYVIGGFADKALAQPIDRVEVFRAGSHVFNPGEYLLMSAGRGGASATLLDRSTVFIAGGKGANGVTSRTEVIVETLDNSDPAHPVRVPRMFSGRTPDMESSRAGQAAFFDPTRRVLLLGGVSDSNSVPEPILYNPE